MVGAPCPWEISDQPLYIQICFLTQQACRGMRSDSNLASIYSKEENYWIEQKMEVNTHLPTLANYWIGLKYDGDFSHIESILIDQDVLLLSGSKFVYDHLL